ncbi:hypothetical protein EK21DRAFT_71408 [Setomelanomma holmii]|uniref:Potassium channel tetramerisation-type BTB domain-containing protein n=1 Tax=Setomelanomma holmii TaxID=210430 RepID=A0A9P4H5R4_9PLEO|nr:hypothetical protein EK21DRAFT_71408 [Setomelanomma holmii]
MAANGESGDKDTGDEFTSAEAKTIEALDAPTISAYPTIMTLNIGGRFFKVSRDTLNESGLFRHQLSDRFTWESEADGSYFLGADSDLFEHLLRFMRRPEVFPLFYDKAKGFEYDLYNRLGAEAEYFQIDVLRGWIKEKKYLQAVITTTSTMRVDDVSQISGEVQSKRLGNVSEDWRVRPRTRKVYICPRGIYVHGGNPDGCGAACQKARGHKDVEYDDETYEDIVIVQKEVDFVESVCRLE